MTMSLYFKAALFDLDGTLIDSLAAVERSWTLMAQRNGLDPDHVLKVIHGRPARESLVALLPNKDEAYIDSEMSWLENLEATDTEGTEALAGSVAFLNKLNELGVPWAIVTSGTYPVASARIKAAGLPWPEHLVTAEKISKGKPDPEPYLLGAELLGNSSAECIVFEDAPAGVNSGKAANSQIMAILSHHSKEELNVEHAVPSLANADVHHDADSGQFILSY